MNASSFRTRRSFLRHGLTLIGGAATVPTFLQRTATALAGERGTKATDKSRDERVLVVIQLAGGNDGLNTIIPVRDDAYYRARRNLAIARGDALKLTDDLALHPQAVGLKSLFDAGLLSIVQGVGYPNPNRSHFTSTDIWMSADPTERTHTGWIGRYFDCSCRGDDPPEPKLGIALTGEAPLALSGRRYQPIAFGSPDQLSWRPGRGAAGAEKAFAKLNRPADDHSADGALKPAALLAYLQRTALDAQLSAEQIQRAAGTSPSSRRPRDLELLRPDRGGDIGPQLRSVARMIAAGLPTRVYYVSMRGFDTHANQQGAHARLMEQLGEGLSAFFGELKESGQDQRVLAMTFSEFGRRVAENGSGGTDHGAAAPLLLAGPSIKPGVHGKHPSLTDLDNGDLKWHTDFRRVYASVLSNWLKADARKILGGEFGGMNLFA